MPSDPRPGRTGVYISVPDGLLEQFRDFARGRGSTLTREVLDAMRRHMTYPPPAGPAALPDSKPGPTRGTRRGEGR